MPSLKSSLPSEMGKVVEDGGGGARVVLLTNLTPPIIKKRTAEFLLLRHNARRCWKVPNREMSFVVKGHISELGATERRSPSLSLVEPKRDGLEANT